ncbi:hypothetical protein [Kitasatospora sp. MAP5-34]|uniref:hypothetical protein n=1 Tax=Kitasatospora sp. MAP5-34 TaxID=3035102 RepID=UPI002476E131|nr:hypothetical protein [Kitasatospora sp. MAP5-34]MDH6577565.1 hypothetical protein [Kitasatospora sp. MAP5-34]
MNAPTTPRAAFRKVLDPSRADAEVRGWQAAAHALPVPDLLGRVQLSGKHLLAYEDVFASGRCTMLLGDVIATADRDPAALPRVTALIDAVCDSLLNAVSASGHPAPLSACVPGLYLDRIRPGGRIDTWYLSGRLAVPTTRTGLPMPMSIFTGHTFVVNGIALRFDLPSAVRDAREALYPGRRWITALTQGDPTEPNIADPLCWLDFEYAGRNSIGGEIAILLWYLLGMGGWLVPSYQPDVYARTLPLHLPPVTTPHLEHVDHDERHRRLEIRYTWPVGAGRQAAITRLLGRVRADLAPAAGLSPDRFLAQIRYFLTLRILGVIPPARLTSHDLLLLLAKLAEAQDPEAVGGVFTRTAPAPATGPDDWTDDDHSRAA